MKLNEIYMRDPFIFVENDVAYLIGTTDEQAWGGKAHGFKGYKSTDLENFEGPYQLFTNSDDFWAFEHFWAPEMHKINGKYYIFASFIAPGHNRSSQALVCDTPLGTYVPLKKPFTPEEWMCLDATYFEENGKKFTIFCHEWSQIHDGEVVVAELESDLCGVKNPKSIFKASDSKWAKPFFVNGSEIKNYVTDGPFIYKTKSGRLLMLWSSVSDNGDYAQGLAYCDNGIMGDWKLIDEPLCRKDSGHGMIFEFKGKKYLILHNNNRSHPNERPVIQEVLEVNNSLVIKNS